MIGRRPLLPLLDGADLVSVLATDLPASDLHAEVGRLLLDTPSRLPGRRHPLYCCPECGDLSCGAVTAVIVRHDKHIIWRDFGWQDEDDPESRDSLDNLGHYRFRVSEYRNALQHALSGLQG